MCGIAGAMVFNKKDFRISYQYINRMRDTMAHRGPDGAGTWVSEDGRVGLGHRRLSIIDLSEAASQPMSNEDGSVWICLNGEIYNHAAIRLELEQTGVHQWKTDHSDTEALIHAFEEWGIDCVKKLRGDFAVAIWDGRKREMWLIRDRLGVKPVYYSFYNGRLTFASEIKALLQDPERRRSVNEEALYYYLSFMTAPAPLTLFDGIYKLPAATWIRIDAAGRFHENRYWDVWDHTEPLTGIPEEEIAVRILEGLREAAHLRKIGDVPMGVFLSGGIDSSTNAALFAEGETGPVKTFTIGYRGQYMSYKNELEYARLMAGKIGAEHHEHLLDVDDLIGFMPRMVYLQDEPIADPVCVPNYYVSKLARDNGVIVCQVGEGADELFWGYSSWKTALRLQKLNDMPVPRLFKRAGLGSLKLIGREATCYYEWLRRGEQNLPVYWSMETFTGIQKQQILSSRMEKEYRGLSPWDKIEPIHRRFQEKAWEKSHLNWMTYLDLNLRLPELLLMRLDKMSMAVGLEGRVPFLDHRFVELAMSIPEAVKTRHGINKYILKKAVRGLIPDELIDRKKQGFSVPLDDWFFHRLGTKMKETIADFNRQIDYFDTDGVEALIERRSSLKVWHLFNLAMWWNEFIGQR